MQEYSDPKRESDPHTLPDIEVFQLTAAEVVERDEELMYEALKQFPLAGFNRRDRQKAIDWAIEESGTNGGYFYWYCFPGCLPDSEPIGPFDSYKDALADAQANQE